MSWITSAAFMPSFGELPVDGRPVTTSLLESGVTLPVAVLVGSMVTGRVEVAVPTGSVAVGVVVTVAELVGTTVAVDVDVAVAVTVAVTVGVVVVVAVGVVGVVVTVAVGGIASQLTCTQFDVRSPATSRKLAVLAT